MKLEKVKAISSIVALLVFLQFLVYGITQCVYIFVRRTDYSDRIVSMFAMIIITISFILIARMRNTSISVFPRKFSMSYIIATIVALILMISTPSNFTGGFQPIVLLVYSSIVMPVFEELIFRGYVWNKLNSVFTREWKTYTASTILFALWHIGYISPIAFRVSTGLAYVMMWKVITGLSFGIILGAVRLKTKNCYSTILLHGVMNIFGR